MANVERIPLPICSGFYKSQSLPLDAQNCVNWLPIIPTPQKGALSQHALFAAEGITEFANLRSSFPTRGAIQMANIAYFVNGVYLYQVAKDGFHKRLGYISGSGPVSIANNGSVMSIVVPGGPGYVFDPKAEDDEKVTRIIDVNYVEANSVVYKDGYFIYTASNGNKFFISELNQPEIIDPLGFGSAQVEPDKIVTAYVSHNELFILGEDTIEIFQNVGGSGFPFQRISGGIIQKGVHSIFGVVYYDNTFLFLGGGENEKSAIWKVANSSTAQKVSPDAIDYALQQYTPEEISNSIAYSYADNGHFCAAFTIFSQRFDMPSVTFVLDATASALSGELVWHQRQSGTRPNSWRVNSVIECYGKLLCGDNFDGRIGEINGNCVTEYGEIIWRQKTSMPFDNEGKAGFFGEIEITPETGVGQATGEYTDPMLQLAYSNDGGRNFTPQSPRSMGKIGAFNQRCIWRRQGYFLRSRMLRITCAEPVKAHILKAACDLEGGTQ